MNIKQFETNYYFDMDGVLAIYERKAYPPESDLFRAHGQHYYATVQPDRTMREVVIKMIRSGHRCHTLSTLSNKGDIFLEQKRDKELWLENQINSQLKDLPADLLQTGYFHKLCQHYTGNNKQYIGEALSETGRLERTDILIDDYNRNLIAWENAGGTAVKYSNGINNPDSYNGFVITQNMTADQIIEFLKAIADSYNVC